MLPIIIITYLFVCICTYLNTQQILRKNLGNQIKLTADSVSNEINADVKNTIGILENIKTSIERSCSTDEEIKDYIYSISDAYPNTIPTGIYCGLCNGTYIDKMWTPDEDWVLTERPWYQDGLNADNVTFGETYLDANSGKYIISIFTNIKNSNNEVLGVVSADVQLDNLNKILTKKSILSNGYVYVVDKSMGMIFGNKKHKDFNGKLISDINDNTIKKVKDMMEQE